MKNLKRLFEKGNEKAIQRIHVEDSKQSRWRKYRYRKGYSQKDFLSDECERFFKLFDD